MKRFPLSFLFFILLLGFAGSLKAQWVEKNNGMYGGTVLSLVVNGTNLFTGTSSSGVFLSTNNGSSWTAVNTGLTNTGVWSLVVSGTNLFAGTTGGVFLSTNIGSSWTALNTDLTYVMSLAVSGTNLFAGTDGDGLFLSTNNGSSWTAVNTGLTSTVVRSLAVSGTNLFAGTSGGVFLSTNDGSSWTAVNTGLTGLFVTSLAISSTGLFAGTSGGVFLSTNNGSSWTAVNTGLTNSGVWSLAVNGTNLFAGTEGGVFLSNNNGSSWTAVNTGLTHTYVRSLAVSSTNLIAGTWGGGVWSRPLSDFPQKIDQTITFNLIPAKTIGDAAFTLSAIATSSLPVSYTSSDETVVTISGNTVTIVGSGSAIITAKQAGNTNYNAAPDVTQTLIVNKTSQSITFNSLTAKTFGDAVFALSAIATSSLPVSYTSSDETVVTISGNTVTIVSAGTATITAKQGGNANYTAAIDVSRVLTVNKASQTITFNALTVKTFGAAEFTLSATSTSGLPISYASSDETVATISGSIATIVGAGTVIITAKQSGNENYNAATEVTQVLTVSKAAQTITFSAISNKAFGEVPFNLTATSTSGLGVQYSTASDKISLSGNQVTLVKPGSATIKADQIGNSNFGAAASLSQSFCINPTKPTISASGLDSGTPLLTSSSSVGNQWYKNGILIIDAVSTTFSPTLAGSYSVKITIDNCSSELSAEQTLLITGDVSKTLNSGFFVYPNPVNNILTINLTTFDANTSVEIVVYDMLGKEIDKITRTGVKAAISVSTYSTGTYFIKASQHNKTYLAKFAKE